MAVLSQTWGSVQGDSFSTCEYLKQMSSKIQSICLKVKQQCTRCIRLSAVEKNCPEQYATVHLGYHPPFNTVILQNTLKLVALTKITPTNHTFYESFLIIVPDYGNFFKKIQHANHFPSSNYKMIVLVISSVSVQSSRQTQVGFCRTWADFSTTLSDDDCYLEATPYNGLHREAPPKRGTFSRLQGRNFTC